MCQNKFATFLVEFKLKTLTAAIKDGGQWSWNHPLYRCFATSDSFIHSLIADGQKNYPEYVFWL